MGMDNNIDSSINYQFKTIVMKARLFLFAAAALILAACSNSEADEPVVNNEIRLFTKVAGSTRAANTLQGTQFANGTTISVQVTDEATSGAVTYDLATYTADGSGGLSASTPQYYPASGSGVTIKAYHPAGAAESFSVQTDQSGNDNYNASDLMWATPLTGVTSGSDNHTLSFSHLMSKIVVQLATGTGLLDDEINAATVKLGNADLITGGTFSTVDGTFTAAGSGSGTYTIATNAGTSAHAAIIVPQSVAGKTISVAIGGATKSYTIPDEVVFAAGKVYTYTLTVNKTGLTVSSTITDWTAPDGWSDPTPSVTF